MTKIEAAKRELVSGDKYPYDAPDDWYVDDDSHKKYPPVDWAHRAARAVINDLSDRRGIKNEFEEVDEDVRKDIIEALAEIIRQSKLEEVK
jgi:hypothetical protein